MSTGHAMSAVCELSRLRDRAVHADLEKAIIPHEWKPNGVIAKTRQRSRQSLVEEFH